MLDLAGCQDAAAVMNGRAKAFTALLSVRKP